MSFSLNEVEALAKRATRGAGYTWGMAEEAGKATRWLCAHGVDGCAVLATLLEQPATSTFAAAVELSDTAHLLRDGPFSWNNIKQPAFLLPFAAMAARKTGQGVVILADNAVAALDGDILHVTANFPEVAERLQAMIGTPSYASLKPAKTQTRARSRPAIWVQLERLAHLTYAPATDASRRLGAGTGASDSD